MFIELTGELEKRTTSIKINKIMSYSPDGATNNTLIEFGLNEYIVVSEPYEQVKELIKNKVAAESKVLTKYELEVAEYDATGYYVVEYKTTHTVISESLEQAEREAIKRTPSKYEFSGDWVKTAKVISSEDIVVDSWKGDN